MAETPEEAAFRKLDVRVGGLQEVNRSLLQEIAATGASVELGPPRVEKFAQFLVEKGLISAMDALVEQESWELHLREKLKPIVDKVRKAAVAAGQDVQTKSGLILPGQK